MLPVKHSFYPLPHFVVNFLQVMVLWNTGAYTFNLLFFRKIMGGIWSFFYPKEDLASRQRHRQQQLIIQEIESIEACVYCYLDNRLQTLLLPYASKSYPWDQSCDILPYFRERSESQSKSCYHCLKGSLIDHFSCQIIDQIFKKNTKMSMWSFFKRKCRDQSGTIWWR